MEKRIIAVICVLMLLISLFAACGKAPTIKLKEGVEYPLVTDEEGNTVVDENGDILVYVTDAHGKYVKDENGNRQTNAVTFPDAIVTDNKVETADYVLLVPEGWTADDAGKLVKDNTENAIISIDITNLGELRVGETLTSYIAQQQVLIEGLVAEMREKGATVSYDITSTQFQGYEAANIVLTAQSEEIGVCCYKMIYYMAGNELYKILYSCANGTNDDTAFDLSSFMEQNLTMK